MQSMNEYNASRADKWPLAYINGSVALNNFGNHLHKILRVFELHDEH